MRIMNSAVATGSSNVSVFEKNSFERMRVWDENSSVSMFEQKSSKEKSEDVSSHLPHTILSEKDILELSEAAEENKLSEKTEDADQPYKINYKLIKQEDLAEKLKAASQNLCTQKAADRTETDYNFDYKTSIMRMIIENFSGNKIRITNPFADMEENQTHRQFDYHSIEEAAYSLTAELTQVTPGSTVPGWGLDYEYTESTYSKEGITYAAEGSVTTEDNRFFNFSANLEMVHESLETSSVSIKKGAALIDPLVLNLDGDTELLSDEKFSFDLNNDGVDEEISTLQRGKAFLALDKNNNGIIDNGSELFGPATNDGFAELRDYDSDNSNWIDENDDIFSQLQLWQRTEDGSSLNGLLEHGVGAIYLGSEETAYDLLSDSGEGVVAAEGETEEGGSELSGRLKETSFFLKEDGSAGLVHEVDFAAEAVDEEEGGEGELDYTA